MEEGAEELLTAAPEGLVGLFPSPPQTLSDRINGDSQHHQTPGYHDDDQLSITRSSSPSHDLPRVSDGNDEHETVDPARGEDAFESFHRSFTVSASALNSIGSRDAYGPSFPDACSTSDQMTQRIPPQAPAAETSSPGVPQGVTQEEHQQPQQQPQQSQKPQSSSDTPPLQVKEDPTVVQARRSMMARTGDRHARGKLPEPTDGRFLAPDCPPLAPQMPPPRSSKRYMNHKKRSPDVFEGIVLEDSEPGDDDHVVSCRGCNLDLLVRKAAVVVRCKNCGEVNPASSVGRFDRSQFTSK